MSTTSTTTTAPRPKRHQLTLDQHILIITKRARGKSYSSISEETNVSKTEATAIVKRWESNRELRPRPGRQPKKGLSRQDRRRLVQIREERPGASVREIWDAAGVARVGVGVRTVGRFLRGVEMERKRVKRDGVIQRKKGGKKDEKMQVL
ncbi:hypothetical protein HOY80DRAFT_1046915 [Tuber brumale]|nr:hypothetical protein HOY80DRAFT_1046915 [Tuber brumale]